MFGQSFSVSSAILLGLLVGFAASQQPQVTVEQGALFGTTETFQEDEFINITKNIDVFKGIPFAEPPVGPLRFKAPVEKSSWGSEVYNATYFRDSCIQNGLENYGLTKSEDCLHLNVYAPSPMVPGGVPVMVWIHEGGFTDGGANLPDCNGIALAAVGDVIVVAFNYRLNVFGFLTTADEASPGNVGMMDQVMALRWVKQNIAAFGGDSERITIFGESAGGRSVGLHILSKMSEGLFNQAIMQSGTALVRRSIYETKDALRQQAFAVGEALGCTTSDSASLMDCLRQQDAEDLLASSQASFIILPIVDGEFLEDEPVNLYSSGRYSHVKMVLGSNADEGSFSLLYAPRYSDYYGADVAPYISKESFQDEISRTIASFYGTGANRQLDDAVLSWYTDWSQADNETADYFRSTVDFLTDYNFACHADQVARYHAQGGDDVFLYQFTHIPSVSYYDIKVDGGFYGPGWTGASHQEEILYIFGVTFIPEAAAYHDEYLDSEKALSVNLMKFWSNFAKTGNPGIETPGSQPASEADYWPMFTIPELGYKELDVNFATGRALKSGECHFWNSYIMQLYTATASMDELEREWRESYSAWKYTDMADWREQFNQYKALTDN